MTEVEPVVISSQESATSVASACVPVRYFPDGLESIVLPSNASDDEEDIPDEAISTVRRAHVSVSYEQDSHATATVVACTQSREVTTTVAWM